MKRLVLIFAIVFFALLSLDLWAAMPCYLMPLKPGSKDQKIECRTHAPDEFVCVLPELPDDVHPSDITVTNGLMKKALAFVGLADAGGVKATSCVVDEAKRKARLDKRKAEREADEAKRRAKLNEHRQAKEKVTELSKKGVWTEKEREEALRAIISILQE